MPENFELENTQFLPEQEDIEIYCPNCHEMWSFEEISFQECDSCGYPHEDMYEDESDYDEDAFYFGFDDYDDYLDLLDLE